MVSVTADFSVETTQSIRQWNNIIKVLNQKKNFFYLKLKENTLTDIQNLK